jgi:16S rRNA processing protein RimM
MSFTGHPDRFASLKRVWVGGAEYELESVWYHKDQPIFKFKGIDSISAAEPLVGKEVTIPENERVPLAEDEYYLSDLVGCRMLDDASGREFGTVTGWQEPGGPILLEIDDGRMLVPFVKAFLKKVDVGDREIRVELPEGLDDLA